MVLSAWIATLLEIPTGIAIQADKTIPNNNFSYLYEFLPFAPAIRFSLLTFEAIVTSLQERYISLLFLTYSVSTLGGEISLFRIFVGKYRISTSLKVISRITTPSASQSSKQVEEIALNTPPPARKGEKPKQQEPKPEPTSSGKIKDYGPTMSASAPSLPTFVSEMKLVLKIEKGMKSMYRFHPFFNFLQNQFQSPDRFLWFCRW